VSRAADLLPPQEALVTHVLLAPRLPGGPTALNRLLFGDL
jgi:hypothetical protein